jgi:hypothetical protein
MNVDFISGAICGVTGGGAIFFVAWIISELRKPRREKRAPQLLGPDLKPEAHHGN